MKTTIELPCGVGETAWYVSEYGVEEVIVDSFYVTSRVYVNVRSDRFIKTLPCETIFFTLEEAMEMYRQLREQSNE